MEESICSLALLQLLQLGTVLLGLWSCLHKLHCCIHGCFIKKWMLHWQYGSAAVHFQWLLKVLQPKNPSGIFLRSPLYRKKDLENSWLDCDLKHGLKQVFPLKIFSMMFFLIFKKYYKGQKIARKIVPNVTLWPRLWCVPAPRSDCLMHPDVSQIEQFVQWPRGWWFKSQIPSILTAESTI